MGPRGVRTFRTGTDAGIGRVVLTGSLESTRGLPPQTMRKLGTYALVLVTSGGGWFADEHGRRLSVATDDLLILFPDVAHTYGPEPGKLWTEHFVTFAGPVFDLWRSTGLLNPNRPVRRLPTGSRWRQRFQQIMDGAGPDGPVGPVADVCAVQALLAEVLGDGDDRREGELRDAEREWLARAKAVLAADVGRDLPLETVAAELTMSYDGFRKRFRVLSGQSPAAFRFQRAIERACELLLDRRLSVRDVAHRLNFCDEFHFSHRFRAVTGQTPRQFRESAAPGP